MRRRADPTRRGRRSPACRACPEPASAWRRRPPRQVRPDAAPPARAAVQGDPATRSVDGVALHRHERCAGALAGLFPPLRALGRGHGGVVVAQLRAGIQRALEPGVRRVVDEVFGSEGRCIHLLAALHSVAAVDEDRSCFGERDRDAPRPGKAVSQGEALGAGGTYSFWCSSVRGTTKPSSPRRASSARSAARRAGPASDPPSRRRIGTPRPSPPPDCRPQRTNPALSGQAASAGSGMRAERARPHPLTNGCVSVAHAVRPACAPCAISHLRDRLWSKTTTETSGWPSVRSHEELSP